MNPFSGASANATARRGSAFTSSLNFSQARSSVHSTAAIGPAAYLSQPSPAAASAACPLPGTAYPCTSSCSSSCVAASSAAAAADFSSSETSPASAAVSPCPFIPAPAPHKTSPAAAAASAAASVIPGASSSSAPSAKKAAAAAAPAVLVVLSCEQQLNAPASSADVSGALPEVSASSSFSSSFSSAAAFSSCARRRCGRGRRDGRGVFECAEFLAEAGVSLSSLLTIHHVFENTGIEYRIATPTGDPPAVSNVAAAPAAAVAATTATSANAAIAAALEKTVPAALYQQLLHPLALRNVRVNDFLGLLLPHHLGAAIDLLQSAALAKLIAAVLPPSSTSPHSSSSRSTFPASRSSSSSSKERRAFIVCAVGYGAYALCAKRLHATTPATAAADFSNKREEAAAACQRRAWTAEPSASSESPLDGYVLTSVSPFDECRYPFFGRLPSMLQELLEDNGASFVSFARSLDSPACVVDRNIVTGPSEASTAVCLQIFALLILNAAAAAQQSTAAAAGAAAAVVHTAAASAAAAVETAFVAAVAERAAAEELHHQQQRQREKQQHLQPLHIQQQPPVPLDRTQQRHTQQQPLKQSQQHQLGQQQHKQQRQNLVLDQQQPSNLQQFDQQSLVLQQQRTLQERAEQEHRRMLLKDEEFHHRAANPVVEKSVSSPVDAVAAPAPLVALSNKCTVVHAAGFAAAAAASELSRRQTCAASAGVAKEIYEEDSVTSHPSTAVFPAPAAERTLDGGHQLGDAHGGEQQTSASSAAAWSSAAAVGADTLQSTASDTAVAHAAIAAYSSSTPAAATAAVHARTSTADTVHALTFIAADYATNAEALHAGTGTPCSAAAATADAQGQTASGCSSSQSRSIRRVHTIDSHTGVPYHLSPERAGGSSGCGDNNKEDDSTALRSGTAEVSEEYTRIQRACVDNKDSMTRTEGDNGNGCMSSHWTRFQEKESAAQENPPNFAATPTSSAVAVIGSAAADIGSAAVVSSGVAAVSTGDASICGASGAGAAVDAGADRENCSVAVPSRLEHSAGHMWFSSQSKRSDSSRGYIGSSDFSTATSSSTDKNSSSRSSDSSSTCTRTEGIETLFPGKTAPKTNHQNVSHITSPIENAGDPRTQEVPTHVPAEDQLESEAASSSATPFSFRPGLTPFENCQQDTAAGKEHVEDTKSIEDTLTRCTASDAAATRADRTTSISASGDAVVARSAVAASFDPHDTRAAPEYGISAVHCAHAAVEDQERIVARDAETGCGKLAESPTPPEDRGWSMPSTLGREVVDIGGNTVLKGVRSVRQQSKAFYSLTKTAEPSPINVEQISDGGYSSVAGSTRHNSYWSKPEQQQQHMIRAVATGDASFRTTPSRDAGPDCAPSSESSTLDIVGDVSAHSSGRFASTKNVVLPNNGNLGQSSKCQPMGIAGETARVDEQIAYAGETSSSTYEVPQQPKKDASGGLSNLLLQHGEDVSAEAGDAEVSVLRESALHQRQPDTQLQQHHQKQPEEQHLLEQQTRLELAEEQKCQRSPSNEFIHLLQADSTTRASDKEGATAWHEASAGKSLFDSNDDGFGNFIANAGAAASDLPSFAASAVAGSSFCPPGVDFNEAVTVESAIGEKASPPFAGRHALTAADFHSDTPKGSARTLEGFFSDKSYYKNSSSHLLSLSRRATDDEQRRGRAAEHEPSNRPEWFQWQ